MPKYILNNWCMTEVEEGEYESQKEVRAPSTENDIPSVQIRTWDHIKAPNKESRRSEYIWKMQYNNFSTSHIYFIHTYIQQNVFLHSFLRSYNKSIHIEMIILSVGRRTSC